MACSSNEILPQTKAAPSFLGKVALLGKGVTGEAVIDYLLPLLGKRLESVSLIVGNEENGFDLEVTTAYTQDTYHLHSLAEIEQPFDLCIASPGIPEHSALYRGAQNCSAEVISEVEFAWRESSSEARWVAITGTNGKSTTTALVAHILTCCGLRASAVGNIGDTCIKAVASGQTDVYVAEVSSYQLASTTCFAPDVALLLNVTPDHLAWHGSFEAYVEAKAKLFANLSGSAHSCAVIDATDEVARSFVRKIREQADYSYIPVGTKQGIEGDMRVACGSANAAFKREDGMLVVAYNNEEYPLVTVDSLLIPGAHNQLNALAAASVAVCLGASPEGIREGLTTFRSLEHRIEECGSILGVTCYNDSKATNVDATLKALEAFVPKRPIVLLGGDDKGTDLTPLVRSAEQHCKLVVCFGAAGPRFFEAFKGSAVSSVIASNMEDALDKALGQAEQGDIVLLSPACASFDEFSNFEHRGRVFKQLVKERQR